MIIRKLTDFNKAEEFLARCFSSPTHWPDWNLIVAKHYGLNFYYLAAYSKAEIIGICPVFEIRKNRVSTLNSGQVKYIPYGGWIFNKPTNTSLKEVPLKVNQSISIFTLPSIESFNSEYSEPINHQLIKSINQTKDQFQTLIVDLSNELDHIWTNNIDSKRRNMIRKAEKSYLNVEIIEKSSFEEFYTFYFEINSKYGLEILNKECLFEILFSSRHLQFKAFVIRFNNLIISCLVMAYDKDYAIYWIGLNKQGSPNLGQGELLQWHAIQFAKRNKCHYYDLCYIEKEKLPNIYEFKKGFAKSEFPIIHFSNRPLSYRIINKLYK